MLALCLLRGRWALAGVLPLLAGLASPFATAPPDVVVNPTARVIALRGEAGYAALFSQGAGRLDRVMVAERLGLDALPALVPGADGRLACTHAACTLTGPAGQRILLLIPGPEETRCDDAALVISPEPLRGRCRPAPMIDRFTVWREGAHAAWFTADGGVRVVSDRALRGDRPWVAPVPVARTSRPARGPIAPALDLPAEGEE
jgi:competence protein ComEC